MAEKFDAVAIIVTGDDASSTAFVIVGSMILEISNQIQLALLKKKPLLSRKLYPFFPHSF